MAAFDKSKAHEIEADGLLLSRNGVELAIFAAGTADPTASGGTPAPMGSLYVQSSGDVWEKTGGLDTEWSLLGLGSPVVTQTMSFGKTGNSAAGAYLNRAGNVGSNISGPTVLVNDGFIKVLGTGGEDVTTFTIEIFTHEGDSINETSLGTFLVTSARGDVFDGLNIAVAKGLQISAKTLDAVKSIGVDLVIKGSSV